MPPRPRALDPAWQPAGDGITRPASLQCGFSVLIRFDDYDLEEVAGTTSTGRRSSMRGNCMLPTLASSRMKSSARKRRKLFNDGHRHAATRMIKERWLRAAGRGRLFPGQRRRTTTTSRSTSDDRTQGAVLMRLHHLRQQVRAPPRRPEPVAGGLHRTEARAAIPIGVGALRRHRGYRGGRRAREGVSRPRTTTIRAIMLKSACGPLGGGPGRVHCISACVGSSGATPPDEQLDNESLIKEKLRRASVRPPAIPACPEHSGEGPALGSAGSGGERWHHDHRELRDGAGVCRLRLVLLPPGGASYFGRRARSTATRWRIMRKRKDMKRLPTPSAGWRRTSATIRLEIRCPDLPDTTVQPALVDIRVRACSVTRPWDCGANVVGQCRAVGRRVGIPMPTLGAGIAPPMKKPRRGGVSSLGG
jgi:hypothetical protein